MANDLDALAIRLRAAAASLTGAQLRAVLTTVGVAAKRDVDEALHAAIGGNSMRNWSRVKLSSGFEFVSDREITLKPRPDGPWQVLERGAGPHVIRAKGHALDTPHGPRASVHLRHGRGKKTWSNAVKTINAKTPERTGDELHKLLQGTLDG